MNSTQLWFYDARRHETTYQGRGWGQRGAGGRWWETADAEADAEAEH